LSHQDAQRQGPFSAARLHAAIHASASSRSDAVPAGTPIAHVASTAAPRYHSGCHREHRPPACRQPADLRQGGFRDPRDEAPTTTGRSATAAGTRPSPSRAVSFSSPD